ncbi:MAG: hypothetical protein HRU20_21885 [Pseudomonadales bacterium]|nr:hypothetical protein [Pseudomonadales bacterium]
MHVEVHSLFRYGITSLLEATRHEVVTQAEIVYVHDHTTYVAEQNLDADTDTNPIKHPLISHYFKPFNNAHYVLKDKLD